MVLISTNYRNVVLVTHQFDAAIKVMIFENSLPLGIADFTNLCGKELKYCSTSAPLPPYTCLLQAGLWQILCLQDLGGKSNH